MFYFCIGFLDGTSTIDHCPTVLQTFSESLEPSGCCFFQSTLVEMPTALVHVLLGCWKLLMHVETFESLERTLDRTMSRNRWYFSNSEHVNFTTSTAWTEKKMNFTPDHCPGTPITYQYPQLKQHQTRCTSSLGSWGSWRCPWARACHLATWEVDPDDANDTPRRSLWRCSLHNLRSACQLVLPQPTSVDETLWNNMKHIPTQRRFGNIYSHTHHMKLPYLWH